MSTVTEKRKCFSKVKKQRKEAGALALGKQSSKLGSCWGGWSPGMETPAEALGREAVLLARQTHVQVLNEPTKLEHGCCSDVVPQKHEEPCPPFLLPRPQPRLPFLTLHPFLLSPLILIPVPPPSSPVTRSSSCPKPRSSGHGGG